MPSQKERPIRITTNLGEDELLLYHFIGTEAISSPFEIRVLMVSENPQIDLKSLLNTAAHITVTLGDGSERFFHGKFRELKQAGRRKDLLTSYEGVLVPALWFCSLASDNRIFQNLTVKEIVEKVLKKNQVTDFKFQLSGQHPKREYCVQYNESDFDFVSRLLEDEGIFYFHEHSDSKHNLVMADAKSAFQACPHQSSASYSFTSDAWTDEDGIQWFDRQESVHTGKVSLTDYSFETPSTSLAVSVGSDVERYEHPGSYYERGEGDRLSKIRLDEAEVDQLTFMGEGRCRAFTTGYKFTLKDHYRADMNTDYTLRSIRHEVKDNNYYSGAGFTQPFVYKNSFEAIPASTEFKPPRVTRRPVMQGPQPAVVVGKSGEEIWVDKYGRVKVHFFWDREGKKNETSSCWVRVCQSWAGKNWGFVAIPRIGQEVVVDFLEGDPDRPIIVGRVYNAEQMPPYTLPSDQTQTGIKSRSSKSGGTSNFNEIRLEDKKGSELFFVQAEKDMETLVKNDQKLTVEKNRTVIIKQGNETITLDQGNRSTQIKSGNDSFKIDMGKSTTEAMQSIELKVGESSVKLDPSGVTIKGMTIKIEGTIQVQVKAPITQVNGDGMVIIKGGVVMIN